MSLELRWTEQAVNQLGAIAEHISLVSPIPTVIEVTAILHGRQDLAAHVSS